MKYDPIEPEVVASYTALSSQKEFMQRTQLVFLHIPLPEYAGLPALRGVNGLFNAALTKGIVPFPWNHVPWLVRYFGRDRIVGCSLINTGLFEAVKFNDTKLKQFAVAQPHKSTTAPVTSAMFCGHDHYCDAVMKRDGVYLCYGRISSTTPPSNWEGDGGPLPFELGARIIQICPPTNKVETWIEVRSGEEPGSRICLD